MSPDGYLFLLITAIVVLGLLMVVGFLMPRARRAIFPPKIEQRHTIYLYLWAGSAHPPIAAAHNLVPHSSLSSVEALTQARAIFPAPAYVVYCVVEQKHLIDMLFGQDSIVVFERVDQATSYIRPGDIVIFEWEGERVLHKITHMEADRFSLTDGRSVGAHLIRLRLTAVFFTRRYRGASPGKPVRLTKDDPHTVAVDVWADTIMAPTHADKPTPHSSLRLSGAEMAQVHQFFRPPAYRVWTTVPNTNSMEPFIDTNTAVIFEQVTGDVLAKRPLAVGDIVIWQTDGKGLVHRIVGRGPGGFYIKGDNNHYLDHFQGQTLIPPSLISARAVGIVYTQQPRPGD